MQATLPQLDVAFDETDLVRDITQQSLYEFLVEFWETADPEPYQESWYIPLICAEIQKVMERVFAGLPKMYDLVINCPPGSSKTSMVGWATPAWSWTRKPDTGIIGSSHTFSLAVWTSRKNRGVVKSEKYRGCFPDIRICQDQDAKGLFANTLGGARMCAGIDGDITGRHADVIFADDLIDPRGAMSEAEVRNANIFLQQTLWSRKKHKDRTPIVLIMQRLCQSDPTALMLGKEWGCPVRHICLPAELSDKVLPKVWAKHYVDGLLDPIRHPPAVLKEAKAKGDYFYAGQFMQNPIPIGGGMFKVERVTIEDAPPKDLTHVVRYWDKAGTKDAGAYTAGVKMAVNCEDTWILDVTRGRWEAAAREATIKQTAEMDGRDVIVGVEQEPGSAGKESAQATVRNLRGFRVITDLPTGDKFVRADPFAAQVNAGNVKMVRGDWNHDYIAELSFQPYATYKDQMDASSGAFKLLSQPRIRVGGGW